MFKFRIYLVGKEQPIIVYKESLYYFGYNFTGRSEHNRPIEIAATYISAVETYENNWVFSNGSNTWIEQNT
jgi:hypothetical protein